MSETAGSNTGFADNVPSFQKRAATPDRAAKIYERNYIVPTDFEYKPITKTRYDSSIYAENFRKINSVDPFEKAKFTSTQFGHNSNIHRKTNYNDGGNKDFDHYLPTHMENFYIHRQKQYAALAESTDPVPRAKVVDRQAYKTIKESGGTARELRGSSETVDTNVYRKNLYVSKPYKNVNEDFLPPPLIRNAMTISEGTPGWFQNTSKYYTTEQFDLTKKNLSKLKNLPKTDIFGQTLKQYEKIPKQFECVPPHQGLRRELNKMIIMDAKSKDEQPTERERKYGQVKINWKEDIPKQKYDGYLPGKVGATDTPFVKSLERKRNPAPMSKIGEDILASRLKPKKDVEIKIGHPNGTYYIPKPVPID